MSTRAPADLLVEVEHRQGDFTLSAAFEAPAGVTALFGRSGSGKTTLVNVIGGLLRPRRGRVTVGGETLLDTGRGIVVPAHRRRIGYVFQEGRLFPHLSVRQNLLFGRWFAPAGPDRTGLASVLDLLDIGHLLARRPGGLSGGEKQRVAIGRALLAKPRLLLMDEPLAGLDDARKGEILPYIERLRDEGSVPIVYVSHAISEVVRLADTLVVIESGRVAACGPASETLARIDIGPLAGTREGGAVLQARVVAHDRGFGLTTLATQAGDLRVPLVALPEGAGVRVQIPARDVIVSLRRPDGLSALNVLAGTIEEISGTDGSPSAEIRLDCQGAPLLVRLTRKSISDLKLVPGMRVFAIVKSVALDLGSRGFETRHDAA